MPSTDFPQGTAFFPVGGGGSGSDDLWWLDVFPIPTDTTGPSFYSLYAYPHNLSPTVTLNGLVLRENDDYNVDYANAILTVYDNLTAGDVVCARYEYDSVVGGGALIPLTAPTSIQNLTGQMGSNTFDSGSFSPAANAAIFLCLAIGSPALTPESWAIASDTWGFTWHKLVDTYLENGGNPDTIHLAIFGARTSSTTPGAGNVTVSTGRNSDFFVSRTFQFTHATPNLNAGVSSGIDVPDLTTTLATKPGASDGVLGIMLNWPHKTVTPDAAYTELFEDTTTNGPYFQSVLMESEYVIGGSPAQTATATNSATADSIFALVGVSPTST